jgi:hypothetical protein
MSSSLLQELSERFLKSEQPVITSNEVEPNQSFQQLLEVATSSLCTYTKKSAQSNALLGSMCNTFFHYPLFVSTPPLQLHSKIYLG